MALCPPENSALIAESLGFVADVDALALKVFLRIFEITPEVKNSFSFLRNSEGPLAESSKLKKHASLVVNTAVKAMLSLDKADEVEKTKASVASLGKRHQKYNIIMPYAPALYVMVVRQSVLETVAKELGDKWSKYRAAWEANFDKVGELFAAGLFAKEA